MSTTYVFKVSGEAMDALQVTCKVAGLSADAAIAQAIMLESAVRNANLAGGYFSIHGNRSPYVTPEGAVGGAINCQLAPMVCEALYTVAAKQQACGNKYTAVLNRALVRLRDTALANQQSRRVTMGCNDCGEPEPFTLI